MNQGQFAGHLGNDAVLRATPSGDNVLNFSVAVTVGFGDSKKTLWVSCSMWGERAIKLEQYLTKGKGVTVAGDVGIHTYKPRDGGDMRAEMTLNVQRLTLMGGGKDEQRQAPRDNPPRQPAQAAQQSADWDDDIPFIWAFALPVAGLLAALLTTTPGIA